MNVTALTAPAATSNWKRVGWVLLLLGALFAAGNAVMFMLRWLWQSDIKSRFFATAIAGWAHTMGGAVASLIGPFQLITKSERRGRECTYGWGALSARCARRCVRRIVFRTVGDAGCSARSVRVARAVLALQRPAAYLAIRRGDVQTHRRWMLRNYALTFGAATLRIELPLLIIGGLTFHAAYTGGLELVGTELAHRRGMAAKGQGVAR